MKNNEEFGFFTISDDDNTPEFEDISSSSKKEPEMEDVYSLSDFTGKGNKKYRKRKKGIAKWWSNLKPISKGLVLSVVALFLIAALLGGIYISPFLNYNYNKITNKPEDLGFENVIDKNIVNIALFGIDTRDTKSFKGNSDSIMILSLNTNTKKVKVISVMRDTLVPITYNGKTTYTKINSAYARGGPELAIKTLNTVFKLDISEYATVNFFGMVDIIDAIGGIEAELTEGEVQPRSQYRFALNGCIGEICKELGVNPGKHYITTPGKHHLNGIQAVAYSRIRKVANIWGTNNDFGRTDRQRFVMEQLFNKAIKLEKKNYVKLAKSLIPCSETSLSYSEIMGLAVDILLKNPTFEQARIPQNEYTMPSPNTAAGSVVYFDIYYASELLNAFIYEDIAPDKYIELNGVEKEDWYRKECGIYTSPSTNSEPNNNQTDEIVDPENPDPDASGGDGDGTETPNPDGDGGDGTENPNPDGDGGDGSGGDGTETPNPDGSGGDGSGGDGTQTPNPDGSGGTTPPTTPSTPSSTPEIVTP